MGDKASAEKAVNAGRAAAQHWDDSRRKMEADEPCIHVLLSLTKYPEDTPAKEFNPRLLVMAVTPDCWSGFKFPSLEDRAAIDTTVEHMERTFKGAPFMGQEGRKVNAYSLNGRPMLEISGVSAVDVPGRKEPLRVHTSFVLSPLRFYWLGVGLVSDTPADLKTLRKLKVTFPAPSP